MNSVITWITTEINLSVIPNNSGDSLTYTLGINPVIDNIEFADKSILTYPDGTGVTFK
jgi:hypothetical protein